MLIIQYFEYDSLYPHHGQDTAITYMTYGMLVVTAMAYAALYYKQVGRCLM